MDEDETGSDTGGFELGNPSLGPEHQRIPVLAGIARKRIDVALFLGVAAAVRLPKNLALNVVGTPIGFFEDTTAWPVLPERGGPMWLTSFHSSSGP